MYNRIKKILKLVDKISNYYVKTLLKNISIPMLNKMILIYQNK